MEVEWGEGLHTERWIERMEGVRGEKGRLEIERGGRREWRGRAWSERRCESGREDVNGG